MQLNTKNCTGCHACYSICTKFAISMQQNYEGFLYPVIDEEKCKQCLLCVPVCPDSAIAVKDYKRQQIDYDHCKGCGICQKICKHGAISMESEK